MQRYPIGIQTFANIIEEKWKYIDKTGYVYDLAQNNKFVFLSRPRRFGKSLLLSTLQAYFEGRKELFEGLQAGLRTTKWESFPVLRFDFSTAKHLNKESLISEIENKLAAYEQDYGRKNEHIHINQRLEGLIKAIYEKHQKQVVLLFDEYDAPLLDVLNQPEELAEIRQIMRNFYSPLKACDAYLRFVFLTGITKFSQLSIFSELNNLENISMRPEYAAICGITHDEMLSQLSEGIDAIATSHNYSREETIAKLRKYYDGYHFSKQSPDIYNPFSLLQAMKARSFDSYWFASGTPTFIVEQMKRFDVHPQDIGRIEVTSDQFDRPTEAMTSILPLLYQSGYITIKDYEQKFNLYTLDISNHEVRVGLLQSLLPLVVGSYKESPAISLVTNMAIALSQDRFSDVMEQMKIFLGSLPPTDNTKYEGHYQSLLYLLFSLLTRYCDVEVRTPQGRVDVVVESDNKVYIIEVKLDGSADEALSQIDTRNYPERFVLKGKPIMKVGVNFSSQTRNIEDYILQPYSQEAEPYTYKEGNTSFYTTKTRNLNCADTPAQLE
ncbi:ATP-binding protein [Prevotella intermedia]|nr:ATP-binding protein [Prevotella intermedia]